MMSIQDKETLRVDLRDIHKSFGGVKALKGVNFSLKPGEVRGLVGENGAGKSTLVKILSGAHRKDSGLLYIDGERVELNSPAQSRDLGIGIIYQEFAQATDLTVTENIFISQLNKSLLIPWKKLIAKAERLTSRLGFEIEPQAKVAALSVAKQQVVEIAKALSEDVKVLILDEPSAVLAPREIKTLFDILKKLSKDGVSIVYISHRLEEIFEISDTVTSMKDGEVSGQFKTNEVDRDALISSMIGRQLSELFPRRRAAIGHEVFRVQALQSDVISDISFSVHSGEVVGIAGLVGSGRTEIVRAIFGADRRIGGTLFIDGTRVSIKSPWDAVRNRIGFVPEDRKHQGVILNQPIRKNVTLAALDRITALVGLLRKKTERNIVADLIDALAIKTQDMELPVSSLSGGNQQKVVLAKWFAVNSRLMILDEPTRGVDVGAKHEIYQLINELAERGLGILFISSELVELVGIADRVLVIKNGALQGELQNEEISEDKIMHLAI